MEDKIETQEELQAQILELQTKAAAIEQQAIAAEDESAKIEMPQADLRLKLDKRGSEVTVKGVTPAELLFLVAEHHQNAGGTPVIGLTLWKDQDEVKANLARGIKAQRAQRAIVRRDPRVERARLCGKYSSKKIMHLFPGTEPVMPKSFTRAMQIGVTAEVPSENLLRFEVATPD